REAGGLSGVVLPTGKRSHDQIHSRRHDAERDVHPATVLCCSIKAAFLSSIPCGLRNILCCVSCQHPLVCRSILKRMFGTSPLYFVCYPGCGVSTARIGHAFIAHIRRGVDPPIKTEARLSR